MTFVLGVFVDEDASPPPPDPPPPIPPEVNTSSLAVREELPGDDMLVRRIINAAIPPPYSLERVERSERLDGYLCVCLVSLSGGRRKEEARTLTPETCLVRF